MDKEEPFIKAIEENEGLIYKIASFYTDDKNDRADLVQEIIYQLWKSFETFRQESALSTWMYRVAMNTSIHHLKKSKKRSTLIPLDSEILNIKDEDDNYMEEKILEVRKHISHLNLLDKGIVMLYLENKSYEEIAEIVGISKTNVGTKLSRIKEKIRQQISK